MVNSVKCLGVIDETNVQCFLQFPEIFPPLFATDQLRPFIISLEKVVVLPALNPYWRSLSCCLMIVAILFLIKYNTILAVLLIRLIVLWSSHLTAFK